ncbi:hypothetical protein [Kribbella sp. NPDC051620]|uniref:hypothetical protein n=1 Tax=Kribbella sp. NPDC051620 TaxID=3364120 RepID=UPI0037BBBDAE
MTDEVQGGTEWVPRFGMLEVPAERAALIRDLFALAAFVADHPELPVPVVQARFYGLFVGDAAQRFVDQLAVVEHLAAALPGEPVADEDGRVEVARRMGSVEVMAVAYSPESWERFNARHSYTANVITEPVAGEAR